jgi:choice-of-anchor A domain-containing protein
MARRLFLALALIFVLAVSTAPLADAGSVEQISLQAGDDDDDDSCPDEIVRNLVLARGFNVVSCQDYVGGVDVAGRAAVARDVEFTGFSIGAAVPIGPALVVGEDLYLRSGTVYGDAIFGFAADADETVDFQGGGLVADYPIDFQVGCFRLDLLSLLLGLFPVTGTTSETISEGLAFYGTKPILNVFEVQGGLLGNISNLEINAPADSLVLINITGPGPINISDLEVQINGVDRQRVLFNYWQNGSISISGISFQGSLLAPSAEVSFNNGQFEGQLIAGNLVGYGAFHHYPFGGEVRYCPDDSLPKGQAAVLRRLNSSFE